MIIENRNIFLAIKLILFVVITGFVARTNKVQAQCGMALKDVVLQEIGEATYLKDFRVRLEEGNPKKPPAKEFAILLNKGTSYRFNIKADKDCKDQVILKLYDFNHFYGYNYDPADGTTYDYFEFSCTKTQVYYLSISFAEANSGCAAAIVSFVGNYNAN
ncbi:MAG: hypothetical protein PF517_22110 [Salinivirgaceae bacterium]|jgi:hypothetical protein|nr:hypothetical protein [Salinivirgaceae bacterium]